MTAYKWEDPQWVEGAQAADWLEAIREPLSELAERTKQRDGLQLSCDTVRAQAESNHNRAVRAEKAVEEYEGILKEVNGEVSVVMGRLKTAISRVKLLEQAVGDHDKTTQHMASVRDFGLDSLMESGMIWRQRAAKAEQQVATLLEEREHGTPIEDVELKARVSRSPLNDDPEWRAAVGLEDAPEV